MPILVIGEAEHQEIHWLSRHLDLPRNGVTHAPAGDRCKPAFPGLSPDEGAPLLILDDGRRLGGIDALLLHLAEGTELIPAEPFARAKMIEWMLWARSTLRPAIEARRRSFGTGCASPRDPRILWEGFEIFERLAKHLESTDFVLPTGLSLADLVLLGPAREAPDAGFDLMPARPLWKWMARVELQFGIGDEAR